MNGKNSSLVIKKIQHPTHIIIVVDKMCKTEMDLVSILGDTEQT